MRDPKPIQKILDSDNLLEKKALFLFSEDTAPTIILKFNLWSRWFFPQYFESADAPFHRDINENNLKIYNGDIDQFINAAFRGAGKDVKTKLFIPFCILNDMNRYRRYFKVLSADLTNSKQTVTDIYNILISPRIVEMYPDTFEKTGYKREETMASFTTAHGVKVLADTIGTEQRGAIQEESRPDFIWFNDFETRKTLRSAVITRAIWDNMEEARTGLQKGGGCIYTCNYISEMGNVHRLITEKLSQRKIILIIPILDVHGHSSWKRYTIADIEHMRATDDDFEGERMCKPSSSRDILFDRDTLERMPTMIPFREVAGFKMFRRYDPSHRYAGGHDVAGGVGLDSSTSVFIDFDIIPAQVVGTFKNNLIKPDVFGDEIHREANFFGGCLIAPEKNNHGHATIARLKQLDSQIHKTQAKATKVLYQGATEFGWQTNALTKPKMMFALSKAVEDGLLLLNDPDLIREAKSYNRNDLMDVETDPRLTTRHFDLLTACAICWQMKSFATIKIQSTATWHEPAANVAL